MLIALSNEARYVELSDPFDGSASCQLSVILVQLVPRSAMALASCVCVAEETPPQLISVSMPLAAPKAEPGSAIVMRTVASATAARPALRMVSASGRMAARSRSSRMRRPNLCPFLRGVVGALGSRRPGASYLALGGPWGPPQIA